MTCQQRFFLHLWFTSLCYFFNFRTAVAQQTIIIDDAAGDSSTGAVPVYSPAGKWAQGESCTGCGFHPDPSMAMNGTWHDTTHHEDDAPRTISFNFVGTSLDVYCILPNPSNPGLTSTYALEFNLDGLLSGPSFQHISNNSNVFQYNFSVFSIQGLTQTNHSFIISAADTSVNSTVLFDYATYTVMPQQSSSEQSSSAHTSQPDSSTSIFEINSSSPSPTTSQSASDPSESGDAASSKSNEKLGRILGGVIGCLAFVAIISALLYRYKYRLRHRNRPSIRSTTIEPFYAAPPNRFLLPYNQPRRNSADLDMGKSGVRHPVTDRKRHHQKQNVRELRHQVAEMRMELEYLRSAYDPPPSFPHS